MSEQAETVSIKYPGFDEINIQGISKDDLDKSYNHFLRSMATIKITKDQTAYRVSAIQDDRRIPLRNGNTTEKK